MYKQVINEEENKKTANNELIWSFFSFQSDYSSNFMLVLRQSRVREHGSRYYGQSYENGEWELWSSMTDQTELVKNLVN